MEKAKLFYVFISVHNPNVVSHMIDNELSESLQSLSTASELSIKPNLASYVPQVKTIFLFWRLEVKPLEMLYAEIYSLV